METLIVIVIIAVVTGLVGRSAYRTLTNSSKQGGCGCGEMECPSKSNCLTDDQLPMKNTETNKTNRKEI